MNSAARRDFPLLHEASKSSRSTVVAEVAKTDEVIEMLALSLDDLDLVGGGSSLGMID